MKKIIDKSMVILLIMLNIMSFSTAALADAAKVVSLGANLNEDQKNQIMTLFGAGN